MKTKLVCDKHQIPLLFDSQKTWQLHMREFHKSQYMQMLQSNKEMQEAKNQSPDDASKRAWEQYYGTYKD